MNGKNKILALEFALAVVACDFCTALKPAMNHIFGEEWTAFLTVRYCAAVLCCLGLVVFLGIDAYKTIKNKS